MALRDLLDADDISERNKPEIPEQDFSEIIEVMQSLTEKMLENYYTVTVREIESGVKVDNLDEIKLHLRQELERSLKHVVILLKDISRRGSDIKITNLSDIVIPEQKDIVIPDFPKETRLSKETLDEMHKFFMRLGDVIKKSLKVTIPESVINVAAPIIPAPIINVQPTDIDGLIRSLAPLERFFNDEAEPLVVRFKDNTDFLEQLKEVLKESNRQVAAFSGGPSVVGLKDSNGQALNPASEETSKAIAGLVTTPFDYISIDPPSQPTTIIYKRGGASGTTVATLTIAYSGSNISTVTKT